MAELADSVRDVVARSADLGSLSQEELRALRERGLRLENIVSYARRVVQTNLDRATLDASDVEDRIRRLAIPTPPPALARRQVEVNLSDEDIALADRELAAIAGPLLAPEDEPERQAWVERQRVAEATLSELRRSLHEALDAITDAIVERVARGEFALRVSVDEVQLPPRPPTEGTAASEQTSAPRPQE